MSLDEIDMYAVIFTSQRTPYETENYETAADRMFELANKQAGFISVDSVRNPEGKGITVSYWESLDAIKKWKNDSEHLQVQKLGKEKWYESFNVKICEVIR